MTELIVVGAWIPCDCGEYFCRIHDCHAFECSCPDISAWEGNGYWPYGEEFNQVVVESDVFQQFLSDNQEDV